MSEEELLEKNVSGLSKLEIILIAKGTPDCDWYTKTESLDIICKYKRFDLLESTVPGALLLRHKTINETYLDFILDCFNNGYDVNLDAFSPEFYVSQLDQIASYYITFAEHDLIEYISPITKEELFKKKKGKKLIDILFEKNAKVTLTKIIPDNLKKDFDIAIYLKQHGYVQLDIDLPMMEDSFTESYLDTYYKSIKPDRISDEAKIALDVLRSFLIDDGKSDEYLVDLLIKSYEYQISSSNPYALRELEQLSYIKLNNPEFRLTRGKVSCFYDGRNEIIINDNIINTINHEIGHALFHLLEDVNLPIWYESVKKQIKSNPETLMKVNELSKKYEKIRNEILSRANNYYEMADFDEEEMQKFIDTEKSKKIESYKQKGFSEEELELLFNKEFSIKNYKRQHRRIRINEMRETILRCEYSYFIAVCDIVDAIYDGKYWDEKLMLPGNEPIKATSGHGINYYSDEMNQLDEIIANYSEIIKSPNRKEGLELLESVLGIEFTNKLKEYYEQNIVYSRTYEGELKL